MLHISRQIIGVYLLIPGVSVSCGISFQLSWRMCWLWLLHHKK